MSKLVIITITASSKWFSSDSEATKVEYAVWDEGSLKELMDSVRIQFANGIHAPGYDTDEVLRSVSCSIDGIYDNELPSTPGQTDGVFDEMRRLREEMDATRARLREVDAGANDAVYSERIRLDECLVLLQQRYAQLANQLAHSKD